MQYHSIFCKTSKANFSVLQTFVEMCSVHVHTSVIRVAWFIWRNGKLQISNMLCIPAFNISLLGIMTTLPQFPSVCAALCLHTHMFIRREVFSGVCVYLMHCLVRTNVCAFLCQLDLNFSMACMPTESLQAVICALRVSFVSVHLYACKCVWQWELFASFPTLSKNSEQWRERRRGRKNEFNHSCVKIAARLSWDSRERGRQQPAEGRRVLIFSSAREKSRQSKASKDD